jgi:rRNA-processing protein EBP2
MAKKNKSRKVKEIKVVEEEKVSDEELQEEMEELGNNRVTLEEIDAMSDGEEDEIQEWNAEANALRQAIADGAFDKIKIGHVPQNEDEDEEVEDGDSEEEEEEQESEEEEDQEVQKSRIILSRSNVKALTSVSSELLVEKAAMPWPEKLDIVPDTPLPFGQMTEEGLPIEVHDDLKREVAFYNLALEAVHAARQQCETIGMPFTRPEDFFAEMVKTDGKYILHLHAHYSTLSMDIDSKCVIQ